METPMNQVVGNASSETLGSSVDQSRHYSVVRFFSDFSVGLVQEVIDADLSLDEAMALARSQSANGVPGEDIVVTDQNKIGLDAEVEAFRATVR